MRKYFIIFFVGLMSVASINAQHPGAGTRSFPLLTVEYNARSAAMAGASAAMPSGVDGVHSNPALLADIEGMQVFLGYRIIDGVWGGPVSFGRSIGRYGVVGANLTGVSSGDIPVIDVDQSGEPVETEGVAADNYLSGGLTWAYRVMDELSVGATVKGVYEKLSIPGTHFSAKGIAVDAGVFYRFMRERFTAGAVIRNAGFVISGFDERDFPMPLTVEAGISFIPKYIASMRLALDVNKKLGDYINFEPGMELEVYKKALILRLGYGFSQRDFQELVKSLSGNNDEEYIKGNMTSLCIGIGVNTKIEKTDLQMNFALQFQDTYLPPSMVISALVDF